MERLPELKERKLPPRFTSANFSGHSIGRTIDRSEEIAENQTKTQEKTAEPQIEQVASKTEQKKQERQETLRQFKGHMDVEGRATSLLSHGSAAVSNMVEDEEMAEGRREFEKYEKPAISALESFAMMSAISNVKSEIEQSANAAMKSYDLIKENKLTLMDLSGSKKELREKLKAFDIPAGEMAKIIKYRKESYDAIMVKSSIMDLDLEKNILTPEQREFLSSNDFFDQRKKEVNDLLKLYFKNSKNEVLSKTNVTGLNLADSKLLEKSGKKNGFSNTDMSAIRMARKNGELKRARMAGRAAKGKLFSRVSSVFTRVVKDEMLDEAVKNISISTKAGRAIYSTAKLSLKAGRLTANYLNKIPPVHYITSQINRGAKFVGNKIVGAGKSAVNSISAPVKQGTQFVKAEVKKAVEKKIPVQTREQIRKARITAQKAKQKAAAKARQTKKAAQQAAKATAKGARTVTKPIRFVGGGIGKVFNFLNNLKAKIAIGFLGVVAAYMILVVLITAILSFASNSGSTTATSILASDSNLVKSMVKNLEQKNNSREAEALALTKEVKWPNVFAYHTISRYGCPDANGNWSKGYTISFVDAEGIQIASGANNSKDVIILTYLLCLANFDTDATGRDALLNDVWSMMNPGIETRVSAIYPCSSGCETLQYMCNDAVVNKSGQKLELQSTMKWYKEEGVSFKSALQSNPNGDGYTSTCLGHNHGSVTTTLNIPEGCDNYKVESSGETYTVKCMGHSVNHGSVTTDGHPVSPSGCNDYSWNVVGSRFTLTCNGHGDKHESTSGSINIPSGCQQSTKSVNGNVITVTCTGTCKHSSKTGTGTAKAPNNCDNWTYEYYCTGHRLSACFGHKDLNVKVTTLFMDDVFTKDMLPTESSSGWNSYSAKISAFKANKDAWNNGWTDGYAGWAHALFDVNWQSYYGIDPLGGVSTNSRFNTTQIANILANAGVSDGTKPYQACKFALEYVGSTTIPENEIAYHAWAAANIYLTVPSNKSPSLMAQNFVNANEKVYDSTSGQAFNIAALKPGDVIFYSNRKNGEFLNITAAVVYIGNGMVVESKSAAYGVIYRQMSTANIMLVGRPTY